MSNSGSFEVPAIAIRQTGNRQLFAFAIDGKKLHDFAQISRLGRDSDEQIAGYQRPEVLSHIAEIRNYLESEAPMLPNAVVVAFDSRVKFRPLVDAATDDNSPCHGHLLIPSNGEKPGWIVDGQQRAAAIRDARISGFPIFVTGFVTDSVAEQREQFILVNSTKPLPKGLIYELLPETDVQLSSHLQRRRFPAYLLERLNYDSRSPLRVAIQTPTNPFIDQGARSQRGFKPRSTAVEDKEIKATRVEPSERNLRARVGDNSGTKRIQGFVKDNSIIKMLENSLHDGALYRCRLRADGEMDVERMLQLLFNFWNAVVTVFEKEWYKPPRQSRLTHGVGVVSMGHLMDAISDRYRSKGIPTSKEFATDLEVLKPLCRWTDGYWDFGHTEKRKWDELQNTSKDTRLLANYLLVQYKRLVWANG
jgi:DGQHR domain-containing protein